MLVQIYLSAHFLRNRLKFYMFTFIFVLSYTYYQYNSIHALYT